MNSNSDANRSAMDDGTTLPKAEARQGVTGHNVRYVLMSGTAAVIVLFALVYIIFFNT
jgi:hypothetical protein